MVDKLSKEASGYIDEARGKRKCENCSMFVVANHCTLVRGHIEPEGHCGYWAKR
jgi:hypothetical protein